MIEFIFPYMFFVLSSLISVGYGFKCYKKRYEGFHKFVLVDILLTWITYACFLGTLNYVLANSFNVSELLSNFISVLFDPSNYLSPLVILAIILFIYNLVFSFVGLRIRKFDRRIL